MIEALLRPPLFIAARIGAQPTDSEDLRLHKTLLVCIAFLIILAGVVWGLMYVALGEATAGAIPLCYSLASLLSIALFAADRHYGRFRFGQLSLILLLPAALMLALGGFVSSSAVILWSLICPLGAVVFDEPRRAPRWLMAYLALVAISGALQPYVRLSNSLSASSVNLFFVMNIAGVSSTAFILLYYFVGQKNTFLELLREEQKKSENLLLNILPKDIASILKNENRTIADHFDGASILFADMVDFTPMSAQLPAVEMVELLNEVFSFFDSLVEEYDLEKIKTVGDCYMVAAGVPRPRADHAQVLGRMALDMRNYVATHTFRGRRVDFRIGINSGPVLAGVIGRKRFIYDLWGDAVNTASRMESHSAGGKIQITRATHDLLKTDFICEPRGTVVVKGKGEMETWFLVGARS